MASKRKRPMSDSLNGRVLDRTVRRSLYLQRYGSHTVGQVRGFLEEHVFPDVLARLQSRLDRIKLRGIDSGFETTKRYVGMLGDVSSLIRDGSRGARKLLTAELRDLAKAEAQWAQVMLQTESNAVLAVDDLSLEVRGLNLSAARAVVSRPIIGRKLNQWFDGIAGDLQRRIETEVGVGMTQGETMEQIMRRIRGTKKGGYRDGVLENARRQAETVARTTVNQVSSQAREATYAENADIIKGVQWVSTLDTKTSNICKALDGKVFPLDSGQRPPAHPNCRSSTVPVTKSWRELGAKLLKRKPGQRIDRPSESTRASMDGQVPESVTYGDWLRQQPESVQVAALGAGRARLFRQGKVQVEDLISRQGKPLPLAELPD